MLEGKELGTEPYKGVRDFYPAEWAVLMGIFTKVRSVLDLRGYEEYNASPLERAELYEAKTSEEIVNEQTYTFTDRGERRVTLRPEMTPTLARMVAAKRRELSYPLRWFSIPNVFRYERPQRGRLREHYQVNVDLVGLPEGEADVEIVSIASALLKAFGAKQSDFVIRVNSRKLLSAAAAAAGLKGESIRSYTRLLDKKSKMPGEEFSASVKAITDKDPLAEIETAKDAKVREAKEQLLAFIESLAERGVGNAVFDPTLTRGFDYYTGIVFEVFDTNPENPRALFGGGRFDGLVALFGGEPIPAAGFAFGDVTLVDFLETHGLIEKKGQASELFIGTPSMADMPAAQRYADELRLKGIKVFVNLRDKQLGDQAKDAEKRGIRYFLAYGKEEQENESVTLKDLPHFENTTLKPQDVAGWITSNR